MRVRNRLLALVPQEPGGTHGMPGFDVGQNACPKQDRTRCGGPAWGRPESGCFGHGTPSRERYTKYGSAMKNRARMPQPTRNGRISQLGQSTNSNHTGHKTQIVGIPPFPHQTKDSAHNGIHPLPTTTRKIQAYLPVGAEYGLRPHLHANPKSLKFRHSYIKRISRRATKHTPF